MKELHHTSFAGERPLYRSSDLHLVDVTIHPGESSIKHGRNILAEECRFEGKYVFWECDNVKVKHSYFADSARSSIWYSRGIVLEDCDIDAPKLFRRASGVSVLNSHFHNALETFWDCANVRLQKVRIEHADYLFMHGENIDIRDYHQDGNYSFQYARNVEIHDAVINSKDSFWESEDCTIYDSEINGEYLGWYAKNLRLVRCHISGEQPLCYCENLVLEDCTFAEDADRAFEYSSVEASIRGRITSIKKPYTGVISADEIGETLEADATQF